MRCWNPDCRKLIPNPEIIDGEPGQPGMLRRMEHRVKQENTEWADAGVTERFTCPHCGTEYKQVTMVIRKRDIKRGRRESDQGRGEGWD